MTFSKYLNCGCMRLGTTRKYKSRREWKEVKVEFPVERNSSEKIRKTITRKEFVELLFEHCIDCRRMAAIPQGAFAACKVRRNLERNMLILPMEEKEKVGKENFYNGRPPLEGWELTPLKYNSKLMNSIWGLYNRYSVHNFKKNTDSNEGSSRMFAAVWEAVFNSDAPAANAVAAAAAATANNSQIITNGNSL